MVDSDKVHVLYWVVQFSFGPGSEIVKAKSAFSKSKRVKNAWIWDLTCSNKVAGSNQAAGNLFLQDHGWFYEKLKNKKNPGAQLKHTEIE